MAIGGDEEKFSIRRPGGAGGAEFVAAIGEISVGDLARSAAFRGNDKNLHEAWLQIACAVESIDEAIIGGGWLGPLGSRGRRRADRRGEDLCRERGTRRRAFFRRETIRWRREIDRDW